MQNGSPNKLNLKSENPYIAGTEDAAPNVDDEPPAKKRKIADTASPSKTMSRPASPPWKKVTVEGPTSFVEGGRRKSSRTNMIPLELQQQNSTRRTRAAAINFEMKGFKAARCSDGDVINNKPAEKGAKRTSIPRVRSSQGGFNKSSMWNDAATTPPAIHNNFTKAQTSPRQKSKKNFTKYSTLAQNGTSHLQQPSSISSAAAEKTQLEGHLPETLCPKTPITYARPTTRKAKQECPTLSQTRSSHRTPQAKLQKIKLTLRMPSIIVQSPANIPLPKHHSSFQEFLDANDFELKEGEVMLTTQQVVQEARVRKRANHPAPARARLEQELKQALPDRQKEPKQYSHHDHLLAHALHFRKLLHAEYQKHRADAKRVAYEAAKRARSRIPKSAEEIEQEQTELEATKYRQVVKDMSRFWTAVEAEVSLIRQDQVEKIEQARKIREFNEQVEKHTQMLAPKTGAMSVQVSDGDDESAESVENSSGISQGGDENMSSSGTESEADISMDDAYALLTREELRANYAGLSVEPSLAMNEDDNLSTVGDFSQSEIQPGDTITLDDVDQTLLDEDSESIDTDDGEDSSISDSNHADDGTDEETDEDDEDAPTLSSLFGPTRPRDSAYLSELSSGTKIEKPSPGGADRSISEAGEAVKILQRNVPETGPENAVVEVPKVLAKSNPAVEMLGHDHNSISASTPASPRTSMTKASDEDSFTSSDARADSQMPATPLKSKEPHLKTPVPSILRGTLRGYQHEGLDWLANLYVNHRNGILADEMGLGKTIQTIALLAHLAVEHHVWGPHLIIVPSSVLLNWEMELKKFCPGLRVLAYYGNINERKQKRRGWMDNDLWHVIITSYQIVLQDQKNLKRRNWHYMVLDEAHNIKNFRSQRWQTMLTFKTRARLLLTGTPLQNNLTELWSLLFFLRPTDLAGDDDEAFAGLSDFSDWFKKPVNQILDQGRETMDDEAREHVTKLHKVIRPYLLRRLKADVEKQMPAKYEHIELCRLSKRQRQLYDEFMSRTKTKDTLASGNYFSIIDCLMQLRKVCNHPDLFETRPVTTSFAMSRPVVADFEISDLFIRRKMLSCWDEQINLDFLQLAPISDEAKSASEVTESSRLQAFAPLEALRVKERQSLGSVQPYPQSSISGVLASIENVGRQIRVADLEHRLYQEYFHHRQRPIYGDGLLSILSTATASQSLSCQSAADQLPRCWDSGTRSARRDLVQTIQSRATTMQPLIQRFACITPLVVASGLPRKQLSEPCTQAVFQPTDRWAPDPFHEARTRLAIAFPDKRLLQYDCGKLQRLDKLLRQLQTGGHRALIFTQMTRVLDILEQFLNIHGHRYLRLDGATKIEQRQILTERFNNDTQFLAFILSSRSGGLGINLTGADTVIFYDLDWNPAMDKQCQDRCHRIGQTRDVHIYRFVSEHTIESNILRKSNQKRMLDDVVIQEGDFTTEHLTKLHPGGVLGDGIGDLDDGAGAALDKVLGSAKAGLGAVLEKAEDKEDAVAAVYAEQEDRHADDGDFDEKVTTPHAPTPSTTNPALMLQAQGVDEVKASNHLSSNQAPFLDRQVRDLDTWVMESMIGWKNDDLGEIKADTLASSTARDGRRSNKKKKKKGAEHRITRPR